MFMEISIPIPMPTSALYGAEAPFVAWCFCPVCGELWAPFGALWTPRGLCLACGCGLISASQRLDGANDIKLKAVPLDFSVFSAHWCSRKAIWCDVAATLSA